MWWICKLISFLNRDSTVLQILNSQVINFILFRYFYIVKKTHKNSFNCLTFLQKLSKRMGTKKNHYFHWWRSLPRGICNFHFDIGVCNGIHISILKWVKPLVITMGFTNASRKQLKCLTIAIVFELIYTYTNYVCKIGFFWPPNPLRLRFLWYKSLLKVNFFDHLPPSSCKHSLWTAP